jgi:RNA polymerase sigma factor (sigma-70 family)
MTHGIVHIVDDDESMRASLLRLLRARGFAAEGYSSAGDFLLHASMNHHGCMLVDLRMPGPSGLDLQAALQKKGVLLPVVFMTGHGDVASCAKAMRGGAVDFLEKPIDPVVLMEVVEQAIVRDIEARSHRDEQHRLQAAFQSLSGRERQVFDLVVAGKLNKQIAQSLNVAERTVKAQRSSLMAKLDIHSAAALGQFAERLRAAKDGAGE